jgi:hypothetical protein
MDFTELHKRNYSCFHVHGADYETTNAFHGVRHLSLSNCSIETNLEQFLMQTQCESYLLTKVEFVGDQYVHHLALEDRKSTVVFDSIVLGCGTIFQFSTSARDVHLFDYMDTLQPVDDSIMNSIPRVQTLTLEKCNLQVSQPRLGVWSLQLLDWQYSMTQIQCVFPALRRLLMPLGLMRLMDTDAFRSDPTLMFPELNDLMLRVPTSTSFLHWNKYGYHINHAVLRAIGRYLSYRDVSAWAATCRSMRYHWSSIHPGRAHTGPERNNYRAHLQDQAVHNIKVSRMTPVPRIYGDHIPFQLYTTRKTKCHQYQNLYAIMDSVVISSLYAGSSTILPPRPIQLGHLRICGLRIDRILSWVRLTVTRHFTLSHCQVDAQVLQALMPSVHNSMDPVLYIRMEQCVLFGDRMHLIQYTNDRTLSQSLIVDNRQRHTESIQLGLDTNWVWILSLFPCKHLTLKHCRLYCLPHMPDLSSVHLIGSSVRHRDASVLFMN